jgi:P27 family predicted phage terminase small subunit
MNRPKPTALKLLQGNPGRQPLNKREAKPRICIPPCPKHLTPGARSHWKAVAPKLARVGLLTEIDDEALGALCEARAIWVAAKKKMAQEGITLTSPNGYTIPSPSFTVASKALKQMQSLWAEFGMTPSSRSRIKAGEPAEPDDPFEELLRSA